MITVRALSMLVEDWSRETGQSVSWHEMVSVRRSRAVCRARSLLIWLARRHTSLSLPQIGRQMGGRDHTTILYNCRVVDALIAKADAPTLTALDRIEAEIEPLAQMPAPITATVAPPGPQRLVAYDRLVDAVEAVLSTADAAALARGTRQAGTADLALTNALSALRSARSRILAHDRAATTWDPCRPRKTRLAAQTAADGGAVRAQPPFASQVERGLNGPDPHRRAGPDAPRATAA